MAVKVCPSCGEGNKEAALICVVCGTSLQSVTAQGTLNSEKEYVTPPKRRSTFCGHCREPLDEGAMKCKYCGTFVSRTPAAQSHSRYDEEWAPSIPDSTSLTLIVISTIVIPIVGLIIGGLASFSDDSEKRDTGKMLLILGLVMIVVQLFLFWIFI